MLQTETLTALLIRAHSVFLKTDSERETFETLLEDTLALTQCKFGFFAEVCHKRTNPYLKMHSISNIAWNRETNDLYNSKRQEGLEFHDLNNMLGVSIRTLQPTLSNDFAADERTADSTPQGHPPIYNFLSIPVFSADSSNEIIGLIGMANKDGGFLQQDVDDLQPLVNLTCILIERSRLRKQNAAYSQALYDAAYYDQLTKLPNRRMLDEYLEGQAVDAQSDSLNRRFSLCYLDLDGFKQVNDCLGHDHGDLLLVDVARRLKHTLPQHDFLARLSGDEFVIVMHGDASNNAYQRVIDVVSKPFEINHNVVNVSASMGVAVFPDDVDNPDQLVRHADHAMYLAKESGKNQYCVFDSAQYFEKDKQAQFVREFVEAVTRGEIHLYLQPKVKLSDKQIIGFEVLCRWHHPQQGVLAPYAFLPKIEGAHAAIVLDQFILLQSYDLIAQLRADFPCFSLNVNVTPEYFNSEQFESHLSELEKANSKVDGLVLEIVESTALGELDTATARINRCRNIGFKLSLDDFGTSFSSLTYFRTLPVDEVKIDRSFTQDLLTDHQDATLVKAIIDMSKSFSRLTVAEGVEFEGQVDVLNRFGCEYAQGFLFAKPMPVPDALEFLKQKAGYCPSCEVG